MDFAGDRPAGETKFYAIFRRSTTDRPDNAPSRQAIPAKTRVNADNILRKGEYFTAHKISIFRQLIVKYIQYFYESLRSAFLP
ncbi:hypothetical protein M5585_05850 [Serratia ureilytica]